MAAKRRSSPHAHPAAEPRRPSELEGAVLGLLWRSGPMTAHAVRTTFLSSPTDHFSGSAGSIYPLIRRLSRTELIEPSRSAEGIRGGTAYTLTREGRRALKAWIDPADDAPLAGVTFDPLRTRVLALGVLSENQRECFLARAERELESLLAGDGARPEHAGVDVWARAAVDGARDVLRARLHWIRSLRRAEQ